MTLNDKLNSLYLPIRNPSTLFNKCVSDRLKNSKNNYEYLIEKNCIYILSRNNSKALKALNRYQKRKEKDNYEEENKYGFIETF